MTAVLGLDISKAKIHAVLRFEAGKLRHKTIANAPAGFRELLAWTQRHVTGPLPVCLEATGTYGHGGALFLHDAGYAISIVNPAAIRAYAASQLSRTKTDDVDAALIAHFAATQHPIIWTPPAPEIRVLQALIRRLDALVEMRTQEMNRLAAGVVVMEVRDSIDALLASLDAQIAHVRLLIRDHIDRHPDLRQQRDLLTTIPGIGEATAATLIAELFDKPYANARQAAAFAGVVPGSGAVDRGSQKSVRRAYGKRCSFRRSRPSATTRRFERTPPRFARPEGRRWSLSAPPCGASFTWPSVY